MSLDTPTPLRIGAGKPPRAPIPGEPSAVVVAAAIQHARLQRIGPDTTRGDDRLETRGNVVVRRLWRRAYGEGTGRYACSIAQLVAMLAPIMGWEPKPPPGPERERWINAHRRSVIRWLEDLQAGGVLTFYGQHNLSGRWWRTVIELHDPEPDPDLLRAARRRAAQAGWRASRRQARDLRLPRKRRPIEQIRCHTGARTPQSATRARLARERASRRKSAQIQQTVRRTHTSGCGSVYRRDLAHPFGASPTSQNNNPSPPTPNISVSVSWERARAPGNLTDTPHEPQTSNNRTEKPKEPAAGTNPNGFAERARALIAKLENRERLSRAAKITVALQAQQRAREFAQSPAGRGWPLDRWREAHAIFAGGGAITGTWQHGGPPTTGVEAVAEHGPSAAGPTVPGLYARIVATAALYESACDHRPPGWPATATGAFCHIAALHPQLTTADVVARLERLARNMNATRKTKDPHRAGRQARKAERRITNIGLQQDTRFQFRLPGKPVVSETADGRAELRDRALKAGLNISNENMCWVIEHRELARLPHGHRPGHRYYQLLDGATERADRYVREIKEGLQWPGVESQRSPSVRALLGGPTTCQ